MLRERFDRILIIDLRGDTRGTRPATVPHDENVFNIEVGVCILIAYATGERPVGTEAEVRYADVWAEGAFSREDKLQFARAAAVDSAIVHDRPVEGTGMDRLKPRGFSGTDWPGVEELFTFRSNGIVTYRDSFVYATTREALRIRIQNWLILPLEQARAEFVDSAMNKVGPALRVEFSDNAIEGISYRPFDLRWLYNRVQYVDRQRPELRQAWGYQNIALVARERGTGAGPAIWSHGLVPDQHAFRGSAGGWVFPLTNHAAEGLGYFLAPNLVPGLSAAYGFQVEPQQVFDAILALLSATSYTTRFAHDLEDDFPHVPFPANPDTFREAARIGARIRSLQTFAEPPAEEFRRARLIGHASGPVLDVPTPQRAFAGDGNAGYVALLADRSLRIANVSERTWQFSVSGYQVLYRWLRARNGDEITAVLQRNILDTVGRIDESLHLFDEADRVLAEAVEASLTRAQIGLTPREEADVVEPEDVDEPV